jgi:hypothetical protein
MGFQVVALFVDSFLDDVNYVRDVEVCMCNMICCIPGCICYGSENFGLGSLHDDYVGLAGATQQFRTLDNMMLIYIIHQSLFYCSLTFY